MSQASASRPRSSSAPDTDLASRTAGPLAGRVALVTGVSRRIGIGTGITGRLLADGARVLATGWPPHDAEMPWGEDPDGIEALLTELGGESETGVAHAGDRGAAGEQGERLAWRRADLEDPATPDSLVAEAIERFGALDVLVANHARSSHDDLFDVTARELDRCWAANARASVLLAQSLGRRRPEGPGGRLVLFTSGQHIGPMWNEIAYAVTKGAIHQMTASLSDALIGRGITVNCINPGPVDTGYAVGRSHERVARRFPGGRWGTPDDVARLVAWLASDEGRWITGQVLNNDGGFRYFGATEIERER